MVDKPDVDQTCHHLHDLNHLITDRVQLGGGADVRQPAGGTLHDAIAGRWPDIQVLYISGHTGEDAVLQRLIPPDAEYLQKPFTPARLIETVARLLATQSSA